MVTPEQRKAVVKAIRDLIAGNYQATALKIELEADLDRDYSEYEDDSSALGFILEYMGIEPNDNVEIYDANSVIKYMQFYNDGSVDSELTFTVKLSNPEKAIDEILCVLDAWNSLREECGGGSTEGAGMHMALLNSRDCSYPTSITSSQELMFNNFKRSMGLLLPALFFLATPNYESRALEYRKPEIGCCGEEHGSSKFQAIHYKEGAIEFRVFDTCYDNYAQILDNIVVMRNCMKFWSPVYKDPGVSKICTRLLFGNDISYRLDRFYNTATHIDVLNYGLRLLKPEYRTIKELKEQRRFTVTKNRFRYENSRIQKEAVKAYKEYEERFDWRLVYDKYYYISQALRDKSAHDAMLDKDRALAQAESVAEQMVREKQNSKVAVADFIQQRITEFQNSKSNYYTLST